MQSSLYSPLDTVLPKGTALDETSATLWKHAKTAEFFSNGRLLNFMSAAQRSDYSTLLNDEGYSDHCSPMWKKHVDAIVQIMCINPTQLFSYRIAQYAFYLTVAQEFSNRSRDYTAHWLENGTGEYVFNDLSRFDHIYIDHFGAITTESRVHHLTHLAFYQMRSGNRVAECETIMEFGGGYGGMSQLISKLSPNSTQIVVDLPPILAVQYFGLANMIDKKVNVVSENSGIKTGALNLVPSNLLGAIEISQPDLFIATWSLSESDKKTFDLISNDHHFFDARNILYGYRFYDTPNPHQPMSKAIDNRQYTEICHEFTPWTLYQDNKYQLLVCT